MRVAVLSTEKDRCGIADYTSTLSEGLASVGVDVVRVSLDASRRALPTFVDDVRRQLERARPDVVHVQHEYSFFGGVLQPAEGLTAVLLRTLGTLRVPELPKPSQYFEIVAQITVPLVVTLHELIDASPAPELGLRWGIHRALVREANRATFASADGVVTHSEERKQRLLELGLRASDVNVIPLAIPRAPALPDRSAARAGFGIRDEFVLLTAGFLSRRKGVEHIIRALASLPERAVLVIVGENHGGDSGAHREELERVAAALGVADRIRFTGFLGRDVLDLWLAAADVFVLTPLEMGGASASLAMGISAGLPIVAWAHSFMEALELRHGCIQLVPFLDEAALAKTLGGLLDTPGLVAELRMLSVAAREAGSPAEEGRLTRALYERLRARKGSVRRRHASQSFPRTMAVVLGDARRAQRARRNANQPNV